MVYLVYTYDFHPRHGSRKLSAREFVASYDGVSVDSLPLNWVSAWNCLPLV